MNEKGLEFLDDIDDENAFWSNLTDVYNSFESDKSLNRITINSKGKYIVH